MTYKWKFSEIHKLSVSLDLKDIRMKEHFAYTDSEWEPDLSSYFTKNIKLELPIVSAAMDTVTESDMAIKMALHGGIGVIHKNLTPDEQAREVEKVKRFKSGFITEPITVSPETKISEIENLKRIYGFSTFPVTHDGTEHGILVGVITDKDYSLKKHGDLKVGDRMVREVVTAPWPIQLEEAYEMLIESRKGKLFLVDNKKRLVAMITRKDLELRKEYPKASKDKKDRLRVAAAVGGPGKDLEERAEKLYEAGVDAFVIDTSQGFSSGVEFTLKYLKKKFEDVDVVSGNITSDESAKFLIELGADAIKVGIGPGSTCITRNVTGIGGGQLNAIYECSRVASEKDIPTIADGGMTIPAHIIYAIAAGANSVMTGYLLAGHEECPGEIITIKTKDGGIKKVKRYRGMGSVGAIKDAIEKGVGSRYFSEKVVHGEEIFVDFRGSVSETLKELETYLKHSMKVFCGAKNIEELRSGNYTFEIVRLV